MDLKCTYASVAKTNFPGEHAPGHPTGAVRNLENGTETRLKSITVNDMFNSKVVAL